MSTSNRTSQAPLIEVHNLTVTETATNTTIVGPLSLSVAAGECLALVGDSGSGKSLTLKALMRLLPAELTTHADRFLLQGQSLVEAGARTWNAARGAEIAIVQQDTGLALDPLHRIEREVSEAARVRIQRVGGSARAYGSTFVAQRLREVGLDTPEELMRRWPHQLSGGQRQRVVLASSLSANPALLLADEPTTALDAEVQNVVLSRLRSFLDDGGGVLLVSHDEAVVRRLADRVLYLNRGQLSQTPDQRVETVAQSRMANTRPTTVTRGAPLCKARDLSFHYASGHGIEGLSLELHAGEVVGLLGESGAGKTTLAKALTGLLPNVRGSLTLDTLAWLELPETSRRHERWRVQWVPQDPLSSFPRGMSVANIVDEAIRAHPLKLSAAGERTAGLRRNRREHVRQRRSELLDAVGLDPMLASRRPLTLSGGQRQRVAIARALAARPQLLICDEPISALDARARDGILQLLADLAKNSGCAVLFISHDREAVRRISDRTLLLEGGRLLDVSDPDESDTNR